MNSALETTYYEAKRPYSINELKDMKSNIYKIYNFDENVYAEHSPCNHLYYVKKFGKKYNQIKDTDDKNVGNCSVCWKLSKTPKRLLDNAYDLINAYEYNFLNPNYTYDIWDTEVSYYNWLYKDFN